MSVAIVPFTVGIVEEGERVARENEEGGEELREGVVENQEEGRL